MVMAQEIAILLAALIVIPTVVLTGYQILSFQSGPTITFAADLSDSNGDGKANANENVHLRCSATDSNGLDFILLTATAPDASSTNYGSGGAAGGATSWTYPSFSINLVQVGTYTFICTAKNVNGTSSTSTKTLPVVAATTCNPSTAGSCIDPTNCQNAGGKWCMGGGWSNSYCDVSSASCTPSSGSACGNGICDKGEGSPGPIMCPQDCGGTPTPSSTGGSACGSGSNIVYCNDQSSCSSFGGKWCQPLSGGSPGCANSCSGCTSVCNGGPSSTSVSSPSPSPSTPSCNENSRCDNGESQYSCSIDCNVSSSYPNCGNGKCDSNEDWANCYKDCSKQDYLNRQTGSQEVGCDQASHTYSSCATQEHCNAIGGTWCASTSGSICKSPTSGCSSPPSPCNENGVCDAGESQVGCSVDCGVSKGYVDGCGTGKCGDGACNINCNVQEDYWSCYKDCPKSGLPIISPTPTIPPGPPKITSLGFTSRYPIVGETTTVHCDALDSSSISTVKLTVTSPSNKATEKTSNGQGTYGTAMIADYLLEEGLYTLTCEASDWDKNIVRDSKTIKVSREKPAIIPHIPTELSKVIKSEILSINKILEALKPTEVPLNQETSLISGFKKLTLEVNKNVSVNATVEVKILDDIPIKDEKGQSLTQLPSPDQPSIKIIQFTPTEELKDSIKQAVIDFELTDQELSDSSLTPDQVVLVRFEAGKWEELPTEFLTNENGTNKFKATTTGFSVFIVTRKLSSVDTSKQKTTSYDTLSCSANSDCAWYSANKCTATTGAIWRCGNQNAPEYSTLTGTESSCTNIYIAKPEDGTCGCVRNKCGPIDKETGTLLSARKSSLLEALITIEQFKIRFDHLSETTKAIANYYLSANKPSDYTTWLATSDGFFLGVTKLDNIKKDIKAVKSEPTENDVKRIGSEIDDVLKILDSSLDFLLKDVLDIGNLPDQEKLIPLAEGQSIKFQINNETHTMTVKSIEADGSVKVEIASTIQNVDLQTGQEQNVKVADTTSTADTLLKLTKVEKNVAYVSIKSISFEGIASKKKIECTKVSSSLTLSDNQIKCLEITADNIVLDGNNQLLDGDGLAYGILAENRKRLTIKNFVLTNYLTGIKLSKTTDSVVENNKISSITGIDLSESSNNQIKNNQVQLVRSSGTAQAEEQKPEGQNIILNEVVLVEKGSNFEPLVSITNNIDPTDYKDVNGNPLTQIEYTIETSSPGSQKSVSMLTLGKGQTKLVKTGASVNPVDNKASISIRITAQNGLITQEFTREARTDI